MSAVAWIWGQRAAVRLGAWSLVAWSLAAWVVGTGCSAPQPPPETRGLPRPLVQDSTPAKPPPGPGPARTTTARFRGLLDDDAFAEVRQCVAEDRYSDAARLYALALKAQGLQDAAEPKFLLGRLHLLAGENGEALVNFERYLSEEKLLADYARTYAGQAALATGARDRAIPQLLAVDVASPVGPTARLWLAEAWLASEHFDAARGELESLLSVPTADSINLRVHLRLAEALLGSLSESTDGVEDKATQVVLARALAHLRAVALRAPGSKLGKRAAQLEMTVLARMPPKLFAQHQALSRADQLVRLRALVSGADYEDALAAADDLLRDVGAQQGSESTCEVHYLRGKALAGTRRFAEAATVLAASATRCRDDELGPKVLFLAGKNAQIAERYAEAVRHYEMLERRFPASSLADDSRIRRADSYLELGDESRFTQLLAELPSVYPEGDMVLDGVFQLALRYMDRGDWATAGQVLGTVEKQARRADVSRDHEYAGRERYFLARSWISTGEVERGLDEFERLVREQPLSFYMQLAYSQLRAVSAERAAASLQAALSEHELHPFDSDSPLPDDASFERGLSLLRVGELDWAEAEFGRNAGKETEDLWRAALLYARAGATERAHKLVRGRLIDWLGRWPVGTWREAWELAFPRPYHDVVTRAAEKHELDEALIYAVMREESGFNPKVVSHADAYGLMQLIRPTAKHFARQQKLPWSAAALKRPSVNIQLGAAALRSFTDRFPDNPLLGVPGYNAGPGRPKRWLQERPDVDFDLWVELIPFRETRRYTKRVLASRGVYRFIYGRPDEREPRLPLHLHASR